MAHYALGDIQGCFDELQALLHKTGFTHGRDTLWLTGDIVNRGQTIARMGNTDADRVKLHFEVRKDGKTVNPASYVPL